MKFFGVDVSKMVEFVMFDKKVIQKIHKILSE